MVFKWLLVLLVFSAVSLTVGYLLGKTFHEAMPEPTNGSWDDMRSCKNCQHDDVKYNEEPCASCTFDGPGCKWKEKTYES